ncbi:MAG: VWA domain-containing protein [Candidatus Obscuribacterales bacterium]|nr:VWA domain-containing protein [Candidatus Obscuribacterales bacterium]
MEDDRKKIGILLAAGLVLTWFTCQKLSAKDIDNVPDPHKVVNQDKKSKKERPRMDLAFCIDTTGSMQAEIDMVKSKVKELVAQLAHGNPSPDIRVGMIAFRDRGDEYVTKTFKFTDDIDQFVKDIDDLKARGGGDGPEAVCQALHASVNDLEWDASKKTSKLLFLIGDAGPKVYKDDYKWEDESRKAIARGIQINTIGCEGLQSFPGPRGMDVFKQIAKLADGQFELLAYKQVITRGDGKSATLVRAGGETYEMKADIPSSEWTRGAKALMAEGKVRKVAAPSMSAVSSRGVMPASAPMGMADSFYESGSMARGGAPAQSFGRKTNNLDSVLIRAARKKAEKDLNVDYSD